MYFIISFIAHGSEEILAAMPDGEHRRRLASGYIHSVDAGGLDQEMVNHITACDAALGGGDRNNDLLIHILIPFLKHAGHDVTLFFQSHLSAYRIDLMTKQVPGNPQSQYAHFYIIIRIAVAH